MFFHTSTPSGRLPPLTRVDGDPCRNGSSRRPTTSSMKPPLLVATRAVVPDPPVRVSVALELDPLADATGRAPSGLDEDDAALSIGGTFSLPPPCFS